MVKISSKLDTLTPYEAGHDDYAILLNANESFVPPVPEVKREMLSRISKAAFNRYPDPAAAALCEKFGRFYGVDPKLVVAGNGSDEIIGLLYACLLDPGDKVMTLEKDFSMYSFYCHIYNCTHVEVSKESDLSVNVEKVISAVKREKPQMLLFSNPCNPTSLGMRREDVVKIIENCDTLVVVDEAYMEFYDQSVLDLCGHYDNLIVLKTCSKALALAALRVGFAISSERIIYLMKTGKSPYNVNTVSQIMAEVVLENPELIDSAIGEIKASKRMLYRGLTELAGRTEQIVRILPSDTNFVFLELTDCEAAFAALKNEGILVRKMGDFLRISAGTMMENDSVLEALAAHFKGEV